MEPPLGCLPGFGTRIPWRLSECLGVLWPQPRGQPPCCCPRTSPQVAPLFFPWQNHTLGFLAQPCTTRFSPQSRDISTYNRQTGSQGLEGQGSHPGPRLQGRNLGLLGSCPGALSASRLPQAQSVSHHVHPCVSVCSPPLPLPLCSPTVHHSPSPVTFCLPTVNTPVFPCTSPLTRLLNTTHHSAPPTHPSPLSPASSLHPSVCASSVCPSSLYPHSCTIYLSTANHPSGP